MKFYSVKVRQSASKFLIKVFDAGLHDQISLSKFSLIKFLMENFDRENGALHNSLTISNMLFARYYKKKLRISKQFRRKQAAANLKDARLTDITIIKVIFLSYLLHNCVFITSAIIWVFRKLNVKINISAFN